MLHRKAVVLVVEDSALIRMGAVDLVTGAGFEALEASEANEAIRILEARPDIHLVFTDVGMPGIMDGIRLSHYIRNRWPPVKLIVTSGKMTVDENYLPVGARFFRKPYDEIAIVEAMIGMLSSPLRLQVPEGPTVLESD
jgi:two-component system, response regulator PdtaR